MLLALTVSPRGVCRGVSAVILDEDRLPQYDLVPLSNDGQEHEVEIDLG